MLFLQLQLSLLSLLSLWIFIRGYMNMHVYFSLSYYFLFLLSFLNGLILTIYFFLICAHFLLIIMIISVINGIWGGGLSGLQKVTRSVNCHVFVKSCHLSIKTTNKDIKKYVGCAAESYMTTRWCSTGQLHLSFSPGLHTHTHTNFI